MEIIIHRLQECLRINALHLKTTGKTPVVKQSRFITHAAEKNMYYGQLWDISGRWCWREHVIGDVGKGSL